MRQSAFLNGPCDEDVGCSELTIQQVQSSLLRLAPEHPFPATAEQALNSAAPAAPAAADWEADPRPLSDCLKAWARTHGGRDAAAAALRVSRKTLDGWCDGRGAGQEGMVRRLMTLTDRLGH